MNTEHTTPQAEQQPMRAGRLVNGSSPQGPGLAKLLEDMKKHRRTYYKVLAITFVVVAAITLCIPNYYTCTVKLAPELSGGKNTNGLASLASTFGVNLNSANQGMDALTPLLYPDLMNSVAFRASLFPVKVQMEETNEEMTYYDYLKNEQRQPWWTTVANVVMESIVSIFEEDGNKDSNKVNPFRLTEEQSAIVEVMEEKVACDVDLQTMVITINVTDQDPLIAATMADSVQVRLQDFITDYRTRKARIDLVHNQQLFEETRNKYEKARKRYAAYKDANQKVFLERVRSEQADMENEVQLLFRNYSQVAAQLQLAEAKIQEETPAFTMLQPPTVPVKKSGPKRAKICLLALFLAFIGTTIYAFHKEGDLSAL